MNASRLLREPQVRHETVPLAALALFVLILIAMVAGLLMDGKPELELSLPATSSPAHVQRLAPLVVPELAPVALETSRRAHPRAKLAP